MPFCSMCGAQIGEADPFCSKCGTEVVQVVSQPAEAVVTKGISGKLMGGAILGILASLASILLGVLFLLLAATEGADYIGEPLPSNLYIPAAIIGITFAMLGIAGCLSTLARKSFLLSLAGGVSAFLSTIFSMSFFFVVPILLAIVAIMLIVLSRSDFKKA